MKQTAGFQLAEQDGVIEEEYGHVGVVRNYLHSLRTPHKYSRRRHQPLCSNIVKKKSSSDVVETLRIRKMI